MNDNGDEMDEELLILVDGTKRVLHILSETNDAHAAMQILASSVACMLCSMATHEEEVFREFEMFNEAIRRSVMLAKQNNATAWIEGTPH